MSKFVQRWKLEAQQSQEQVKELELQLQKETKRMKQDMRNYINRISDPIEKQKSIKEFEEKYGKFEDSNC